MPLGNYIGATPKTPEQIAHLPNQPDIVDEAQKRGVTQIVHFTTLRGAVGVLAKGAVLSRERLLKEEHLQYVYQPNAQFRKDVAWLDYVNLSVERINDWMFATSVRWHATEDNPWVVLSFKPLILAHPGVVFTTTNNIYPACRRAEGLSGFSQMFSESIRGRYDSLHNRAGKLSSWSTDRQAEVLYPGELSCDFLQRIDVQTERAFEGVHGILGGIGLSVPVRYAPEVFQ